MAGTRMNAGFERAVNNQVYLILVLINLSIQARPQ
jgi:hypothetical protein